MRAMLMDFWQKFCGFLTGPEEQAYSENGNANPADWSDEQWDEVLDTWVDKFEHYGMEVPGIFLGEAHKPVSFLLGQGVYFFEPFLHSASHFHPALRGESVQVVGALLSDRARLEQLIQKIEARKP